MHIFIKNKKLILNHYKIKCSIGKRGIGTKKKEGDQITPKGKFKIKSIMYRKDRIANFNSKIKKLSIKKNMGWCDDTNYATMYNKLITTPNKAKHEKLFRTDNKYDLLIPIKYNFHNPILGLGSCIFFHLTNNYKPTAGCIALKKKDFFIMLKLLNKNIKINTHAPTHTDTHAHKYILSHP